MLVCHNRNIKNIKNGSSLLLHIVLYKDLLRLTIIPQVLLPKEVGFQLLPHILALQHLLEKLQEGKELTVFVKMVVGENGNAVLWLKHEGKAGVVHKN